MDKVNFTILEHEEDIIISFSFDEGTEFGISGLIIQRNPKFEGFLNINERGASVTWEDKYDIRLFLDQVNISRKKIRMQTRDHLHDYSFDLSKLPDSEYLNLIEHFRLLNFDNSIHIFNE